jgi:hypothetical protein
VGANFRTMRAGGGPGGPQVPRRTGRKRKSAPITLAYWESPTAQRLHHAAIAGMETAVETYCTDAGERTQLKRQRIIGPLEQLWKAGIIDSGQYGAARRYQRDAELAAIVGPKGCARYKPRLIEGGWKSELQPAEAATDYLRRVATAQAACSVRHRPMLEWMSHEPMGWRQQARIWFPDASEVWARSSFQRLLRGACWDLESHYRRGA